MAILNVTPDSFSDGGRLDDITNLLDTAGAFLAAGADILDVGGESTRPGAAEIPVEQELARVLPAIEALHKAFPEAWISIDTRKAAVAKAAMAAGARIINDVSGLQFDAAMANVAAETGAYLVMMHSQGTPATMQRNPQYPQGVVTEVQAFFERQTNIARQAGVPGERIILDPGFGFGKTLAHNLALLKGLPLLAALGYPLLVGTSRKSFLTLGDAGIAPKDREALTAASLALAIEHGAKLVRVHDPETQVPVVRLLERYLKA